MRMDVFQNLFFLSEGTKKTHWYYF